MGKGVARLEKKIRHETSIETLAIDPTTEESHFCQCQGRCFEIMILK